MDNNLPQVTGHRPLTADGPALSLSVSRALTVPEFLIANRMSRAKFYQLLNAGLIETLLINKRRLITPEQNERFRRRCEESARQELAERLGPGAPANDPK
jgi:hypothetical protein